ncbi:hypothetical protein [Nitrososphaera viennensis]|nr:hypothetical protein [Nitrososphaera viennensis]UVS67867.1 hypothetical protein NWT39_08105 [Nitrososphaera viennensis]
MRVSAVAVVLAAIAVTGAIAIPTGNPAFLDRAIAIEAAFIALAVLTFAGYKKQLYACIPLAAIVMVGNSLAPPHVEIMTTFSKPFNAVVLITGGYILQIVLIVTAVMELQKRRERPPLPARGR